MLRTLVFHALWLLLAGYGVTLLARRRKFCSRGDGDATGAPAIPVARAPGGLAWWLALAGIVCLALALRLYELEQRSLWLDEAISVWHARRPWGELLPTLASHDESPPLYFALLRLWRPFGEGEAALRALSVLCSLPAVPLGAALGTALGGRITPPAWRGPGPPWGACHGWPPCAFSRWRWPRRGRSSSSTLGPCSPWG